MGFKSLSKRALVLISYAVLLTSPFTFFPLFDAAFFGLKYSQYHNARITEGISALAREIERRSWMEQWSVPGAQSMSQWENNKSPFFVPQLQGNDWSQKLGFLKPRAHYDDASSNDLPINLVYGFEGLVADIGCHSDLPREWWVYVGYMAAPDAFPRDAAFRRLLECTSANPVPNTKFAQVQCTSAPFLCNIWQVSGLGSGHLVHFLVRYDSEELNVDPADYDAEPTNLRSVEIRVIDLGLQSQTSILPPGVFPTHFEQMKALVTQPGAYSVFEEYDDMTREMTRFYDANEEVLRRRQSRLYASVADMNESVTDYLNKPLGLDKLVGELELIAYVWTFNLMQGLSGAMRLVQGLYAAFLGTPTEFDLLAQRLEQREQAGAGGGLFGGLMNGFVDMMQSEVERSASMTTSDSPGITADADVRKALFEGLRQNLTSVLRGFDASTSM